MPPKLFCVLFQGKIEAYGWIDDPEPRELSWPSVMLIQDEIKMQFMGRYTGRVIFDLMTGDAHELDQVLTEEEIEDEAARLRELRETPVKRPLRGPLGATRK